MSDQIKFRCPFCEHKLEAPAEAVGRRVQCHACEEKFELEIDPGSIDSFPAEDTPGSAGSLPAEDTPGSAGSLPATNEDPGTTDSFPAEDTPGSAGSLPATNEAPGSAGSLPASKPKPSSRRKKKSNSLAIAICLILICGAAGAGMLLKSKSDKSTSAAVTQEQKPLTASKSAAPEISIKHTGILGEVKDTCFRCHGATKNGKPRIKGDFDLRALLSKPEIDIADSAEWRRVLDEVESGNMPPEDSKEELSDSSRIKWTETFYAKLNRKEMKGRLLTAAEIDADHAIMYEYDKDHYNPFETLKLLKISESRYPTINSAKLMSRTFLESLQYGLEELVRDYTQDKYRAQAGHTARKGESNDCSIRVGVSSSAEKLDSNEKASKYFDFRTWGRQRLFSKGHPRFGIVPGRYRLTFTANSMNRDLVAKVVKEYSNPKGQRHIQGILDTWGDLYRSKARISLINSGNDNKQSRKDGVFYTFEIEDGVEKEYSCEFTMTTANLLDLSWDNGPYNPRKHWVKLGREKRLDGENYNFPCVRMKNVKLTKLEEIPSKSSYDISYHIDKPDKRNKAPVLTEDVAKEKLTGFTGKLGLTRAEERVLKIFDDLPVDMPLREKYATAMRLISMSADYLYIDFNDPKKGGAVRYSSYSLLKKKPSGEFRKNYADFNSGKLSAKGFSTKVVQDEGFKNFLKHFTVNWFKHKVLLDTKKFNPKLQNFEYYEETVEYLNYLFTNNRPLKELYHSNYRILDSKMASFYDLPAKSDGFAKYESPQGGILQQVSFFASQSDGIDGLPFRRAEWISENVFDKHLGNPPVNIDTDEFVAAKELKTFKERTDFHSKHSACAACHKVIDPIAFAVNHRGTLGRDLSKLSKNPVKPELDSENAFYSSVSKADRKIASAFTRNLVSYIVGRNLTVFDNMTIAKILDKTAANEFRAGEVYAEIIRAYFK